MMKFRTKVAAIVLLLALGVAGFSFARERNTPRVETVFTSVTAGETVYAGQIVGAAGGYGYVLRSDSTNLQAIGVAVNTAVSNEAVRALSGVFGLVNDGSVTTANIGGQAYAATNDTGYTVSASGAASFGVITAVDDFVWVRSGL